MVAVLHEITHMERFTGELWFVDTGITASAGGTGPVTPRMLTGTAGIWRVCACTITL